MVRRKTGARQTKLVVGLAFLVVAVAGTGLAWTWYAARDQVLSEKPPRSAAPAKSRATVSSLSATATISYAAIADALKKALPATFSTEGKERLCADLKQTIVNGIGGDIGKLLDEATKSLPVDQFSHVCQDVTYQVTLTRTDRIRVSKAGNKLRIATVVAVKGHAGFTGDLARALDLDSKNFRGAVRVFADLTAAVTPDWCPDLQGAARYEWTDKAALEITNGVWLPIDGVVGGKIGDELDSAVKQVLAGVKCDDLRNRVAEAWHPYSFPVTLPDDIGGKVYVNLTPKDAGFSGLAYDKTGLRLALAFRAASEVATKAVSVTTKLTLPPLEQIAPTSNKVSIAVPLVIGYGDIRATARKLLKGRVFEADTPAGHVRLAADDVDVYPSGGRIVIGVHFSARTSRQVLDTRGWVYLSATPELDTRRQIVSLTKVAATRQLDNTLWSALSVLLDTQVRQLIEENATYDLRPEIAELTKTLNKALADIAAEQKIAIHLKTNFAGLRSIDLEDSQIAVLVGMVGTANVSVDALDVALE